MPSRTIPWLSALASAALLAACGGGESGSDAASGTNKTYLRVEAVDAEGDNLTYQWRATGGSIENRNARETVWTMPDGPGAHFAYVTVSDGRGGYVEQQYVVSSDALGTTAATKGPVQRNVSFSGTDGGLVRSTVRAGTLPFRAPDGTVAQRVVYVPDVTISLNDGTTSVVARTDLAGEASFPALVPGTTYAATCTTASGGVIQTCSGVVASSTVAARHFVSVLALPAERNLRLHGHVANTDGSVCGVENAFAGLQVAATVQLLAADGSAITPAVRVNRYGDYTLDAAVLAQAPLQLRVQCEGYSRTVDVPVSTDVSGYVATAPVELSHVISNARPSITKMVANGPEGNVRGRMVVPEAGAASIDLPGSSQFLAFKGQDNQRSACNYYAAIGAVAACDAQGGFVEPISLDDWKRQHRITPFDAGAPTATATYVNKMDLNLVRRMTATKTSGDNIAYVVCNHPGPEGSTQKEVDAVIDIGLANERLVACVAMEWSVTPGAFGGKPFTKFLTFGPDGSLLPSVNLDGRGEKYLPGGCVACHGGPLYAGKFPERGVASPYLGSKFLPFDTGNYFFHSQAALAEPAQSKDIFQLNAWVRETEGPGVTTPITTLIDNWYSGGTTTLNKDYVPLAWQTPIAGVTAAQQGKFYREVMGASCRTCHAAFPNFNWDSFVMTPSRAGAHVCGGSADVAINGSMPNALIARDRIVDRARADPELAELMRVYLGCVNPRDDPLYPKR
jgi:hypothetical protein